MIKNYRQMPWVAGRLTWTHQMAALLYFSA